MNKSEDIDIFHTFNTILESEKPWCISFESCVPRTNLLCSREWERGRRIELDNISKKELDLLASDNCKVLLALSESAYSIQKKMLEYFQYENAEKIMEKVLVLHPPQELLIKREEIDGKLKYVNDKVEILFIGHDFFRKGGKQVINALSRLENEFSFHLTIVSDLRYGFKSTKDDKTTMETVLESKNWITHYKNLQNDKVLELCKKAHIGCLPSLQETYGYSLLEMQAGGIPCITTNIRSFPYTNNEECGWIVDLKVDDWGGEALMNTEEEYLYNISILEEQLYRCFREIFLHPQSILEKAYKAYDKIDIMHNVDNYKLFLRNIYRKCVDEHL